jgi:hypothetical protein
MFGLVTSKTALVVLLLFALNYTITPSSTLVRVFLWGLLVAAWVGRTVRLSRNDQDTPDSE